ncbi:MAG: hypothetical protein ACRDWF_08025 [Acidimicrobiia bacterium]
MTDNRLDPPQIYRVPPRRVVPEPGDDRPESGEAYRQTGDRREERLAFHTENVMKHAAWIGGSIGRVWWV